MPVREEFAVEGLDEPISHCTDAVRYGDLRFVSGVAPLDEKSCLVDEDNLSHGRARLF